MVLVVAIGHNMFLLLRMDTVNAASYIVWSHPTRYVHATWSLEWSHSIVQKFLQALLAQPRENSAVSCR